MINDGRVGWKPYDYQTAKLIYSSCATKTQMRFARLLSTTRLLSSMGSHSTYLNPCVQVKDSCYVVSKYASFARINHDAIDQAALSIIKRYNEVVPFEVGVEWDKGGWHYTDNGPLTCQYVFVMDALNFCFWPASGLEYDTLAMSLKNVLESDKKAFDADRLVDMNEVLGIA